MRRRLWVAVAYEEGAVEQLAPVALFSRVGQRRAEGGPDFVPKGWAGR